MWIHAASAPAASWNSVRRRAQTRRQPDDAGRPLELVADARIGARTATSAARTSQTRPRSRVPGPIEAHAARSGTLARSWA